MISYFLCWEEGSPLKVRLFLVAQCFMVNLHSTSGGLKPFPPKAGFLTLRCMLAHPRFQTPASISPWLVIFFPLKCFAFLSDSAVAKERQFLHAVFFLSIFLIKLSLLRKSNLIFHIFSMKAIKSINSLQKEWDAVGYSKEESPWKLFPWDPVLCRLQAWWREERKAKGREDIPCPFCCR